MSYVMPKYNRLTENDRHFGPITVGARHMDWRPLGLDLRSGDEEHSGCALYLRGFGWTVRVKLPAVIKPWRQWVDLRKYDWAKNDGYWDVHPREYGFSFSSGSLHLSYGPQTGDSHTEKSRCIFLPWKQLRHVRFSLYGLGGEHVWSQHDRKDIRGMDAFAAQHEAEQACPKAVFDVLDFDGTKVRASTYIEEREWRRGEGWFRWLSLLRRPVIQRSLRVEFDTEVGYEKGSWKGGLMGTGIDLEPGELHESAMRRFCAAGVRNKNGISKLTLIGQAA